MPCGYKKVKATGRVRLKTKPLVNAKSVKVRGIKI